MLSVVKSILQLNGMEADSLDETAFSEHVDNVFKCIDAQGKGSITKVELYNFMVDNMVDISHIAFEKLFSQLAGDNTELQADQFKALKRYYPLLRRGQQKSQSRSAGEAALNPASDPDLVSKQEKERLLENSKRKQIAGLKAVFQEIDGNTNGKISYDEFYAFIERTNPGWCSVASSIFHTLDKQLAGEVRFKDLLRVLFPNVNEKELQAMVNLISQKAEVKRMNGDLEAQIQELKDIFAVYDDDGSGELSMPEFIEALIAAGYKEDEAADMFNQIDADHGGTVSLEEFIQWFMANS